MNETDPTSSDNQIKPLSSFSGWAEKTPYPSDGITLQEAKEYINKKEKDEEGWSDNIKNKYEIALKKDSDTESEKRYTVVFKVAGA